MNPANLPKKSKTTIMLTLLLLLALASVILALTNMVAPHTSLGLGIISIAAPLYFSLFHFKGSRSRLFLALAVVASLIALCYVVDMSATSNTAQQICDRQYANYTITTDAESIRCSSLNEGGFVTNIVSSDIVRPLFMPLVLLILVNIVTILAVLPAQLRRLIRKR